MNHRGIRPLPFDERVVEMQARVTNTGTDWKSDDYAEDVPYLIAEIERLRGALGDIKEWTTDDRAHSIATSALEARS